MRIENRGDTEYLVGAPEECDGCDEVHVESGACCHHLGGEHLAVGYSGSDGACKILARWPIGPAQTAPDQFALGVVEGLRRVASMMRDLDGRVVFAERKLELLAECIAAEIEDVNGATASGLTVRGKR